MQTKEICIRQVHISDYTIAKTKYTKQTKTENYTNFFKNIKKILIKANEQTKS